MKCLDSVDFFDKVMNEKYDPAAFGVLVEHLSFENDGFSYQMAVLILRGLNKSNFDEARPFLEAMAYFLNINDYLQTKRIEWVLGFPQPIAQTIRDGPDSFGMFGNNSIDDLVYNYESTIPLENGTSVLNLILINRKRLENLCLVCLRQVLFLCDINSNVFEFFINLPAPSYNLAKFSDWIRPFIENYISDAKRYYYGGYPKEEAGNQALTLFNTFEEKLSKKMQFNQTVITSFLETKKKKAEGEEKKVEEEKKEEPAQISQDTKPTESPVNVLKALTPSYIIGETHKEVKIREVQLLQGDPGVTLIETQATVHITESLPIGTTNVAFPASVVRESYINTHLVKPDSSLAHFIQPRALGVTGAADAPKSRFAAAVVKASDAKVHDLEMQGTDLVPIGHDSGSMGTDMIGPLPEFEQGTIARTSSEKAEDTRTGDTGTVIEVTRVPEERIGRGLFIKYPSHSDLLF